MNSLELFKCELLLLSGCPSLVEFSLGITLLPSIQYAKPTQKQKNRGFSIKTPPVTNSYPYHREAMENWCHLDGPVSLKATRLRKLP